MSGKKIILFGACGLLLLLLIIRIFSGCGKEETAMFKATSKAMTCTACGETYPVSQEQLTTMSFEAVEQNEDGGYILPCLKCGKVSATLRINEIGPDEE